MTEYFLVNKDIKMKHRDGWLDVKNSQLESAAKTKNKYLTVVRNIQDATELALDNDSETRFFPIFRVEVADEITGKEDVVELSEQKEFKQIAGIKFPVNVIKVTDAYLDHIDESYDNVSLAPRSKQAEDNKKDQEIKTDEKSTPVKSEFSQYIPSPKNAVISISRRSLVCWCSRDCIHFGNSRFGCANRFNGNSFYFASGNWDYSAFCR
ncbi:MAG TPA: hypothetical protein PLD88_10990 [Candidatus Berkiella sp.]|nr:hypothetical protein [Candidatus Berkiella sp.]